MKRTLAVATIALAGLTFAGCTTKTDELAPPTTTTATVSIPPQPTPLVGKYPDPEAMAAKIQAAGVPLVASTTPRQHGETDINGAVYLYAYVGQGQVGLFTFDYPKVADSTEIQKRGDGWMTYRGDGWIASAKTAATLTLLVDALNK